MLGVFCPLFSQTQTSEEAGLTYAEQLELLDRELDSLGIFNLLDSLVFNDQLSVKNELNVRASFTNSVTSAGRDYDIDQSGISLGLAYYHKSGFFGDFAGYWNSGVTPNYNPTVITLGYLDTKKNWNYSFDYENWIYNPEDTLENGLTNSISGSLNYSYKNAFFGLDYSYLFGKENAHRIIGNTGLNIDLGSFWKFKYVNLFPTFNILYGNSELTTLRITRQQLSTERLGQLEFIVRASELTDEERVRWNRRVIRLESNGDITSVQAANFLRWINGDITLTKEQLNELKELIETGIRENEEFFQSESFGLLNYSFNLPISFSTNKFSILLSYTYNIPVKLPGEFFEIDPSGFFAFSVIYRMPF